MRKIHIKCGKIIFRTLIFPHLVKYFFANFLQFFCAWYKGTHWSALISPKRQTFRGQDRGTGNPKNEIEIGSIQIYETKSFRPTTHWTTEPLENHWQTLGGNYNHAKRTPGKPLQIAYIVAFFDIHVSHLQPIFELLSVTRDLNKWYNMIKTHLYNICSQIFEFYPDRHFSQCFFS